MTATLTRLACAAAHYSGLLDLAAAVREPRERLGPGLPFQILMYHRVGPMADHFTPGVTPDVFERHIQYVATRCRVLSVTDLLAAADAGTVPARAVAITFDDGYEDVFTYASPILQRHAVPATVYLTTGVIDANDTMWNDRVGVALRDTASPSIDGVPGVEPLPLRSVAERCAAVGSVLRALKPLPPDERERQVAALGKRLNVSFGAAPRMLRWDHIRAMAAQGIEMGGHTVSHPILSAVSEAKAQYELTASKRRIEAEVQQPVRHFAYPNGRAEDFNAAVQALVRDAGYRSAVSTIFGTNQVTTDRFALRRGGPWEAEPAVFAAKLWWYRWASRGD